jgi:hypothetical protein
MNKLRDQFWRDDVYSMLEIIGFLREDCIASIEIVNKVSVFQVELIVETQKMERELFQGDSYH